MRASSGGEVEGLPQQALAEALASLFGSHREVVDLNLVHNNLENRVGDDGPGSIAGDEEERVSGVGKGGTEGCLRPRVREAAGLESDQVPQVVRGG